MNVILNVAVDGWYPLGQDRLAASLDAIGDTSPRLFWRDEWPPGSPSHQASPYHFKPYAFVEARRLGCEQALWCDASVWFVGSLDPIWAWLEHRGVFLLLGDGWRLSHWTSDAALNLYGIDRDAAEAVQLTYNLMVGIQLDHPVGQEFLRRWLDLAQRGAFKGPWQNRGGKASRDRRCKGHRHDQSAASWLAYDMGVPLAPMGEFLSVRRDQPAPVAMAEGM